jgi:proteasome activator subunit 3 (PA28 gamma)
MATSEFAEIRDFHKRVSEQASDLIKKEFPAKVKELDELAGSKKWSLERLSEIEKESKASLIMVGSRLTNQNESEPLTKRKRLEGTDSEINGVSGIPCNKGILDLIDDIKPDISELMERCATIRIWITLLIPKIEDGNNFGVGVQEDALAELRQVEAECATYLDQLSRYFLTRGKMISKVIKYPGIIDYRRCIQELDSKQFVSLRFMLSENRNHYCTMADLINKNMEKIRKPRSSNHAPMY